MRNFIFLLPILVLGCSDMPSMAKKSGKTTSAGVSNATSATSSGVNLGDPKQVYSRLQKLNLENNELCKRVQKQRIECPLANPLVADESEKVLGCVAGAEQAVVGVDFRISVEPPPGYKVYLSTKGGSWQTNEVSAGDNQKLIWGPRKADGCNKTLRTNPAAIQSQVRSPKILELSELDVILIPYDESKCNDAEKDRTDKFGKFEVFVNGNSVFNKSQLSFTGTGHQVDLGILDKFLQDTKCVIPPKEIDLLLDRAVTNFDESTAAGAPPKTLIADYERETSRNQSLRLALTGQEKLGCWAFAKIEKFEVKLEGAGASEKSVESAAGSPGQNKGNASSFSFSFGRGIAHSVGDANGLFKPGGGFATSAFSGREIQELNALRITKQGTEYKSSPYNQSYTCGVAGWFGIETCNRTVYRVWEIARKSLQSLKIIVNDQLLYENNAINFTFENGSLEWPVGRKIEKIQDNAKFRELMRQTSCPAQ